LAGPERTKPPDQSLDQPEVRSRAGRAGGRPRLPGPGVRGRCQGRV